MVFGASKIDEFTEVISIFSFVTQLYLYNYQNRELSYKIAKKGFELIKQQPNVDISSFYFMKFLIFI